MEDLENLAVVALEHELLVETWEEVLAVVEQLSFERFRDKESAVAKQLFFEQTRDIEIDVVEQLTFEDFREHRSLQRSSSTPSGHKERATMTATKNRRRLVLN